jgi:hypothetical protein
MAGRVPAIHVFSSRMKEVAYGRRDSIRQFSAINYPPVGTTARPHRIFKDFSGNASVTVKGSITPVTRAFRIQTHLFPNATGVADEA